MSGNSFTDVDPLASLRAPAAGIFLSYRRGDPNARVGRLYDRLVTRFGTARVFRDVDAAEPGANFEDKIDRALSASRVLIAVIGPPGKQSPTHAGSVDSTIRRTTSDTRSLKLCRTRTARCCQFCGGPAP